MNPDNAVTAFRIAVPQEALDDLQRRLAHVRLPAEINDTQPADGVTVDQMQTFLERWRTGFDWRATERALNEMPQVVTTVDGQRIHAVHRRSPRSDAQALVLLHGWPSTFAEFRLVIDDLVAPEDSEAPAFHIIAVSLPGHGFSGPIAESGWGAHRMARAIAELVRRLGYTQYLTHGGDSGYQVAAALSRVDPEHVRGVHLNLGGVGLAGLHRDEPPVDEAERHALKLYADYIRDKSAYALLNATRPQTVSYALADSPIGQLAWIAEKLTDWVDPNYPLSVDDVLTTASIYWFTNTAASSARFYQVEYTGNKAAGSGPALERSFVTTPTAVSSFPGEIVPPIRRWAEERYNIVRWVQMPAGGHFSALERPDLVVDALRGFAAQLNAADA